MIGEIRDLETAQIAIQAALTGHLVLSTLHTNNAAERDHAAARHGGRGLSGDLDGERRAGAAPGAAAVPGLPRAVRRAAGAGRAQLGLAPLATGASRRSIDAVGCEQCRGTGYRGRTRSSKSWRHPMRSAALVLSHAEAREIHRVAVEEGMRTMYHDGLLKAMAGVTTDRRGVARHAGRLRPWHAAISLHRRRGVGRDASRARWKRRPRSVVIDRLHALGPCTDPHRRGGRRRRSPGSISRWLSRARRMPARDAGAAHRASSATLLHAGLALDRGARASCASSRPSEREKECLRLLLEQDAAAARRCRRHGRAARRVPRNSMSAWCAPARRAPASRPCSTASPNSSSAPRRPKSTSSRR